MNSRLCSYSEHELVKKASLLEVLMEGNSTLYAKAKETLEICKKQLEE